MLPQPTVVTTRLTKAQERRKGLVIIKSNWKFIKRCHNQANKGLGRRARLKGRFKMDWFCNKLVFFILSVTDKRALTNALAYYKIRTFWICNAFTARSNNIIIYEKKFYSIETRLFINWAKWAGATTLSITTFSIMTIGIMDLFATLSITVSSAIMMNVAFYLLLWWMPICWVTLCWVSLCWESLCWVSLCWVSLCWMSLWSVIMLSLVMLSVVALLNDH